MRAQTTFPVQGEVKRDANLRGGPGATYPIQGTAKAGDIITATAMDEAGKWYRLDTPTEQWIAVALLRLLAPDETLAAACAAADHNDHVVRTGELSARRRWNVRPDDHCAVDGNRWSALSDPDGDGCTHRHRRIDCHRRAHGGKRV